MAINPTKTGDTRVFLIEGRARPDHAPTYEYNLRMMGVSQDFGDVTRIEEPDPYEYGSFVEVGQTRGQTARPSTSLEGRLAMDLASTMLRLARKKCAIDIQLHVGQCTDPSAFNTFQKALVFEQAFLTNYNTDDLGALQSGDQNPVNETVDISAKDFYEVLPISFGSKAGSIVTNEVVDVTICDTPSCGDCTEESDGCERVYAISLQAGGSPSTPADVIFSIDKGSTWYAHDIDTLLATEDPSAIGCFGSYLVVVSNDTNSIHYVLKSVIDSLSDPSWSEMATGFVTGGEPNDISVIGSTAFICGDSGYVYKSTDITSSVTAIESGTLTSSVLNAIAALSEEFVVAVGNDGIVMYTSNGSTFALSTTLPAGVGVNLNRVAVKSETEWWVGTSTGYVYYTLDGGTTWHTQDFPGSGAGVVYDIQFATASVVYLAHTTAAGAGRILRSYNGGQSWQIVPEETGQSMPANDRIEALAVCNDPNFVVGVGLADNGTDGFIAVGLD